MHEDGGELVLELAVTVPDGLDLLLEPLDVELSRQDLGRDVSAPRVEVLLELIVDVRRLKPVGRGEHVVDQRRDRFGERLLLREGTGESVRSSRSTRGREDPEDLLQSV